MLAHFRPRRILASLAACAAIALSSCAQPPAPSADAVDGRGCVTSFVAGRDYYPNKSKLTHATNFTISYHLAYQVITVRQPVPGAAPEKYVLHRCGTPAPAATGDLAGAQVIETPVTSSYSGSNTQLPMFAELGRLDWLTGVATDKYVNSADVRARVADGRITVYAPHKALDTEKIVAAKPGMVMTEETNDAGYRVLRDAGIPVVVNAEWLESTPLGRAEWLKMVAAFTGDETKAADVFTRIDRAYTAVAAKAKSASAVTVVPGQMYQGTWYVPAGQSYQSALLADAGATSAWAQTKGSQRLQLTFEEVLAKGRDADTWLMSTDVASLADVAKRDPRYREFAAYRAKRVWSNNRRIGPGGGNDYWETGVVRPDLVLADLVAIVHPELRPDHDFTFYRKLDG